MGSDERQTPVFPDIKGNAATDTLHEKTAQTTSQDQFDISTLQTLERPALVALWRQHCRTLIATGISQPLLRRLLAWEIQAKAEGELTAKEVERLAGVAMGKIRRTSPQMATGARYLREWNGVTHVVEKVAEGFLWNGQVQISLTSIARAITGAHRSGPRFFGFKRPDRKSASASPKGAAS
jgi:hypothetical protein